MRKALGDVARSRGFQVVDVAANAGFCDRILGALTRRREVSGLTVSPSMFGMSLGPIEVSRSATQLGEAMFEASRSHGLLITVDEIQDASLAEMRELGNEIQLLIRQGANVAFAFAGLPASIDGVVVDVTLTFLQRAKHVELTRLSDYEVGDSFEETMAKGNRTIGDEAAQLLVSAAAGYPFMVQLVGYYAWQASSRRDSSEVTLEDAKRGVEIARKSFDNMVCSCSQKGLAETARVPRCHGQVRGGARGYGCRCEASWCRAEWRELLPQASNRCGHPRNTDL